MDRGHSPAPDGCPSRSAWDEFALGRIPPGKQAVLATHLENCRHCQVMLSEVNEQPTDDPLVRRLQRQERNEPHDEISTVHPNTDAVRRLSTTVHQGELPGAEHRSDRLPKGTAVGQFEIRRLLGEGGFGIVYLAFDRRLQRDVALKLPKRPRLLDPTACARLIWEAQATARLSHPNLLPVYEAGEIDGTTYIASAWCPGPTLAHWLENNSDPPSIDDAVRLIICLADAVDYAHGRGVLHRDIKPDNVLLEPTPEGGFLEGADGVKSIPKLTDFGLAKCVESDADRTAELQSRSGIAFGTPAYMAPEQAGGHRDRIDVRTDVYALGALMYRMLTGTTPIRGETAMDTLRRIDTDEPVPPRQIRSNIPRDVQTICLKCLEKSQHRRYESARDLADDLRRFAAGEAISARPAGHVERLYRAARKRPAAAALLLVLAAGVCASVVALSIHNRQLNSALSRVEASERTARTLLYASWISQAWEAWHNRDFVRVREHLEASRVASDGSTTGPCGFEYHLLASLTPPKMHQKILGFHRGSATCVRYSPDGTLLASAGADGILRLWTMPEGREHLVLHAHETDINRVEFSPDGEQFATASDDGTVKLWETQTARLRHVLGGHPRRVFEVVWSGDGRLLASAGDGEGIRLWDVATGEQLAVLPAHDVSAMTVWSDSGHMMSAEASGDIRIWNLYEQRQVETFNAVHRRPVQKISISHDGGRMLTASRDGTAREWDLSSKQLLNLFQGHLDGVHSADYLPGTNLIATASRDRTVRLWDRSGRQMSVVRGHGDCVWAMDVSPDGETIVTASRDGTVRLCRWADWLQDDADRIVGPAVTATEHTVAFSPDGRCFAALDANGAVVLFDAGDATELSRLGPLSDSDIVVSLSFSRDSSVVATGSLDGQLVAWNLRNGQSRRIQAHPRHIWQIAFAPDGESVATCGEFGEVLLWSWPELNRIAELEMHEGLVLAARFSPDGETLATCGSDGTAILWDVKTRSPRHVLRKHAGWVRDVAFSPEGNLVATAGNSGTVNLWDANDGRLLRTLTLADEQVLCLDFNPDGRTLVTGGSQTVRFWQTASGQQLTVFRYPNYGLCKSVAFAPDGRSLLAVAGNDPAHGVLRLWSYGDRNPAPTSP